MGCDCHLHQEVKIRGEWHHYSHVQVDRSYELFGLLSEVRCPFPEDLGLEKCLAEPGIPVDAAFLTKYDYESWDGDAHTPGWIGPEQMGVVKKFGNLHREQFWFEDEFGYCFGDSWYDTRESNPEIEDVRWIFWYDN